MAQYNVTRDIRKLAEEAEKDKNLNSTVATAGLGLGGGFVASQTGGSARNPNTRPTPLQQQIAQNDAQNRANARNQGRTKTSTPKPQPQPEFKIDRRTKEGKRVIQEVVDQFGGNKPPVVKDDPLPNVGSRTRVPPEPTGFRGNVIKTAESAVDLGKNIGENLKKIGPKVGKLGGFGVGQLVEEFTGLDEGIAGAVNIDQGMQDYFSEVGKDKSRRTGLHKLGDLTYDAFNLGTKLAGDVLELPFQTVGAGYDALMKQPGEANLNPLSRTFRGETYEEFFDDVSPSGAGMFARRPNPEINTQTVDANNMQTTDLPTANNVTQETTGIPLEDRSDLEKQIIANQEAGQPLLAGTFENQQINKSFGGEGVSTQGVPDYQSNFLQRKEKGDPITDAEFQRAQQFALKKGMVFDPETGYSKADFFGQMFKGQSIGQFLRGEDAPEGFTDVIGQTADPREEARKSFEQASVAREERLAKRPDFMQATPDTPEGELRLSDYKKLARAEGFKGSAVNVEAKRLMKEDQSKDKMTPYQEASLAMQQKRFDQSTAEAKASANLAERRFAESVRQYEAGVKEGKEADELANLYKRVQILGLLNDIKGEKEELGFDLEPDVINDYVGVLKEFGVEYDPETQVYKQEGMFGKQLNKEDLAKLSPLLKETKFIKLLEYTSKNNQ